MAKVTVLFGNDPQAEFGLERDETTIGRARDCHIMIDNLGVSRHHCSIVKDGEVYKVVDKGSNNGTFVNGDRVDEHPLAHQDRIILGKYSLVYDAYGYAEPAAQERKAAGGSMGSEMTMFVDQDAVQKMQAQAGGSEAPRMALTVDQGGREMSCALLKIETTIGKGGAADVPVRGLLVKPVQAKVVKVDQGHRLVSLGGPRRVRVNGRPVSDTMLQPGDVIQIAGTTITFKQQ